MHQVARRQGPGWPWPPAARRFEPRRQKLRVIGVHLKKLTFFVSSGCRRPRHPWPRWPVATQPLGSLGAALLSRGLAHAQAAPWKPRAAAIGTRCRPRGRRSRLGDSSGPSTRVPDTLPGGGRLGPMKPSLALAGGASSWWPEPARRDCDPFGHSRRRSPSRRGCGRRGGASVDTPRKSTRLPGISASERRERGFCRPGASSAGLNAAPRSRSRWSGGADAPWRAPDRVFAAGAVAGPGRRRSDAILAFDRLATRRAGAESPRFRSRAE